MSEQNPQGQAPSGAAAPNANPNDPNSTTETPPAANPPASVSYEDHQRVLSDMHKEKTKRRELEEQNRLAEEKRLREANDWKTLAERNEQRANEAEERNQKLTEGLVQREKLSAVRTSAVRAGIHEMALNDLNFLDLNGVTVTQSSTGLLQVSGADSFIANLKVTRPYMFGAKAVGVNGAAPSVQNNQTAGLVTTQELVKLSNEAARTGDYAKYQERFAQYQKQK